MVTFSLFPHCKQNHPIQVIEPPISHRISSMLKSATSIKCSLFESDSNSLVSCKALSFLPVRTKVAPSFEHSMAVARPIPDEAPVTSTVFLLKKKDYTLQTGRYQIIQITNSCLLFHIITSNSDIIFLINHCNNQ